MTMNAVIHIHNQLSKTSKLVNAFFEVRNTFYKKRNLLSFPLCAAIEQFLLQITIFLALDQILALNEPTFAKKWSKEEFIILATIIAPIGETIVFQFSVIELLKKFKVNTFICGVISALIFGSVHINNSQYSIYFTTIGGLYFSWGYNAWAAQSRFKAVASTIIQHSLFNSFICFVKFY